METRSADLVQPLLETAEKAHELRSTPVDKRGDTWADDARRAAAELTLLDAEYATRQRIESDELQRAAFEHALAAAKENLEHRSKGPDAAFTRLGGGLERRSVMSELTASDEYQAYLDGRGEFPRQVIQRSIHDLEVRTLLDASSADTSSAGLLMTVGQPIPPTPRQERLFVRDLIGATPTGLHAVPYVRELNPATTETGASTVAEAGVKPEVEMDFVGVTAVMTVIAAWIPVTMQILQDAPILQGYVYTRLAYMIKLREQAEILNGNGLNQDLQGILGVVGIQTNSTNTSNDPFKDIANSIGKVENVDLEADGVAMNPLDFWTGQAERHSTTFDSRATNPATAAAPFGGPPGTLWGLPCVRSRALSSGTAIVAAWSMGAQIFDRMETTIRQSDSHDVFFTANKIAVLAEERIGLAIFRPDAFVKTTITA